MTNFFKHAPPQNTPQKRFMETVLRQQDVLVELPWGYSAPNLYSFPAMLGAGLAVVISPDAGAIQRQMRYFLQSGYAYPDVAVLDGDQMPHEERDIYQQINHNRVRLLFITPNLFSRLSFLEVMLHNAIKFVLVEDAEKLLPGFSRDPRYSRLMETIGQLHQRPPLVLCTMPLPLFRREALVEQTGLRSPLMAMEDFKRDGVIVRADLRITEFQKYQRLIGYLAGAPGKGQIGQLNRTGAVIIQTAFPEAADRLTASLLDYGFDSVWAYHHRKTPKQRSLAESRFLGDANVIVVTASDEPRSWLPYAENRKQTLTLIDWHLPESVERVFASAFRVPAGKDVDVNSILLYTKEDYHAAVMRIQQGQWPSDEHRVACVESLQKLRRWILSGGCRKQTLAAYHMGAREAGFPPCGECDRCRGPQEGRLKGLLKHWLY